VSAGRGAGWVAGYGSSRVELRTEKTCRKLHWRVRARGRFSGCEILGGDSS
jgi:hypothetical protein